MKVLFAVWELAPFFHVGGLGDIARSLPKALFNKDIDVRVALPEYKAFNHQGIKKKTVNKFKVSFNNEEVEVTIYQINFLKSNVPVYLFNNEKYLSLPSRETFLFFNLALIKALKKNCFDWQPEIIHCHDHHTGFIPFFVKHEKLPYKTLLTIHNLGHQGKASLEILAKASINPSTCQVIKWEIKKKQINFLLEGLVHADLVNTVSPTYAKEILSEEYGAGLNEILRNEKQKISGILNGIDYDFHQPNIDEDIPFHYDVNSPTEGKELNKAYLQKKFGFEVNKKIPLICFIGRFDSRQKGLDIIHKVINRINLEHYQFVFLGHGDKNWEDRFKWFSSFYPKNVYCRFIFDNKLASQIYAGSDFILIPSKFEPCGLIQMIAMKYGTLPIARATGGLKDSIIDGVDGFLFSRYSSFELEKTLKKAIKIWRTNKVRHQKMIIRAMTKDFSWDLRANDYIKLYERLISVPPAKDNGTENNKL